MPDQIDATTEQIIAEKLSNICIDSDDLKEENEFGVDRMYCNHTGVFIFHFSWCVDVFNVVSFGGGGWCSCVIMFL